MATDAEVLEVLKIKLAAYETAGMTDHVKKVKAAIAQLEKPAKAPVVKTAAPPVKKAAKKTAKKR